MASTSHLHFLSPFSPSPHRRPLAATPLHKLLVLRSNPGSRRSTVISASTSWEIEESRWLREEQRWLREEKRWLREESRWNTERKTLLREIAALRQKLEALEQGKESVGSVEVLLGPLAGRPAPPVLVEEADVKEMVLEGTVEKKDEEKRALRKGSEGEDVRLMQEALGRIGFYSTEEDMEYHMFSDGTERAVKAWQASLGVPEDGIMTSLLLKRLYEKSIGGDHGFETRWIKEGKAEPNGAPIASTSAIKDVQQTTIKDTGNKDLEVSPHKVFLLGENRWEEPSRLVSKENLLSRKTDASLIKCLSCRGEGRLMCTECDGTGEPNIEPQFLEWIDEGTKCPYCDGLGHTICDVCEGKMLVEKTQL